MITLKGKKNEDIQRILADGADSDFWSVVVSYLSEKVVEANEEMRGEAIRNLPAEQYKVEMEVLQNNVELFERMKDLPSAISKELGKPEEKNTESPDVYERESEGSTP